MKGRANNKLILKIALAIIVIVILIWWNKPNPELFGTWEGNDGGILTFYAAGVTEHDMMFTIRATGEVKKGDKVRNKYKATRNKITIIAFNGEKLSSNYYKVKGDKLIYYDEIYRRVQE